tara:strand:+ start:1549 stop:2091 length:543 start_codon:yes stop_codon:yes gene_type:complete
LLRKSLSKTGVAEFAESAQTETSSFPGNESTTVRTAVTCSWSAAFFESLDDASRNFAITSTTAVAPFVCGAQDASSVSECNEFVSLRCSSFSSAYDATTLVGSDTAKTSSVLVVDGTASSSPKLGSPHPKPNVTCAPFPTHGATRRSTGSWSPFGVPVGDTHAPLVTSASRLTVGVANAW